jgi:alpha-1,3-rhamnosyl/mannosyltransferase
MRVGVEVSASQLSRAGAARYSRQILTALRAAAQPATEIIPLWAMPNLRWPAPGLTRKAWVLYWEWVYCPVVLPIRLRRLNLDILHLTHPLPFFAHSAPAGLCVVATILDVLPISNPEWFGRWMGWRLRRWLRQTASRAHYVLAISEYTRFQLHARLSIPLERCSVTPLAAAPAPPLTPVQAAAPPYLLTVGTLEPRKNLKSVLRAYQQVKLADPATPPLWIVGGGGWGNVRVEELVAQLGLAAAVRVLSYVDDARLAELYRDARALIYPSLAEGFGLPPLEAMQAGCPVITSNTSALPEVVGEAALLVDPLDEAALAQAIRAVCTDSALSARLRAQGMARAALFSWGRCARETLAAYQHARAFA